MQAPILVFERGGNLAIYRSVEHAASTLEVEHVHDGIYEAYDAGGTRLDIKIRHQPVERTWLGHRLTVIRPVVVIQEHCPPVNELEYVRRRLIHFINRRKHPLVEFEGLSMEELLRLAGESMPWQVY